LPETFRIEDLPLDLTVPQRLAESVATQFPVFRDVALQEHRGGLPTMTADGDHVLGPAPGAKTRSPSHHGRGAGDTERAGPHDARRLRVRARQARPASRSELRSVARSVRSPRASSGTAAR